MKRILKALVPLVLILGTLFSIGWYLLVYDREFTRDILISQARYFDARGNADFATKLYDLAYDYTGQDDDVAIELANQYRNIGNYTKAEYTLTNAIADGGSVDLYTALCKIFLEQDKLQDAVAMLDNIADPVLKREIDKLRPAAPEALPVPGFYNEYIDVEFVATGSQLYISTDREYPSINSQPVTAPISLPGGETTIFAVNVDKSGLVSPLTILAYTVSGVIEEAKFVDPVLELALRTQLGLDEDDVLMTNLLWDVKEFTVPEEAKILTDLAFLPNLEKLTITEFWLDSLSFLSSLPHLTELDLTGCHFTASELKYVAGLTNLENLTLARCGLSTIADLAGSVSLKYLDLSNNTLRNLEPLIPMVTLEELYLAHNAVTALDSLMALSALQVLDISYNSVTNLTPLAACESLTWLNAGNNSISTLAGLDTFPVLTHLNVSHNKLSEVVVLGNCTQLVELNLSNNNLTHIDSFRNLLDLTSLDISYNQLYALPSWPASSALATLDASHNNLDSILPLLKMENLTYVYLDYNRLTSLDPLSECYRLVMVNAYGNEIKDVSKLTARNIIVNYDPT